MFPLNLFSAEQSYDCTLSAAASATKDVDKALSGEADYDVSRRTGRIDAATKR